MILHRSIIEWYFIGILKSSSVSWRYHRSILKSSSKYLEDTDEVSLKIFIEDTDEDVNVFKILKTLIDTLKTLKIDEDIEWYRWSIIEDTDEDIEDTDEDIEDTSMKIIEVFIFMKIIEDDEDLKIGIIEVFIGILKSKDRYLEDLHEVSLKIKMKTLKIKILKSSLKIPMKSWRYR